MVNSFFDTGDYTALARNTLARAASVNNIFAAVEAGFDHLPDKLSIQQSKATFVASDTGTANAYVISLEKTPPAYSDGMHICFRANSTNTGAATVNVNGLGVKSLKDYSGAALSAGAIVSGAFTSAIYDNTNGYFRVIAPLVTISSVSTFSINTLTAETSPADADTLGLYDASATADRKMTFNNVLMTGWSANTSPADADTVLTGDASDSANLKKMTFSNLLVNGWGANTAPADGDLVLTADASDSNNLKKITLVNFLNQGFTTETSVADGDFVLIYDASAAALRKMTKANFAPAPTVTFDGSGSTMVSGGTYIATSNVTMTLPASPSSGQWVVVGRDTTAGNVTVARNSQTIEGAAEDLTMDFNKMLLRFAFNGTTWKVHSVGTVAT